MRVDPYSSLRRNQKDLDPFEVFVFLTDTDQPKQPGFVTPWFPHVSLPVPGLWARLVDTSYDGVLAHQQTKATSNKEGIATRSKDAY